MARVRLLRVAELVVHGFQFLKIVSGHCARSVGPRPFNLLERVGQELEESLALQRKIGALRRELRFNLSTYPVRFSQNVPSLPLGIGDDNPGLTRLLCCRTRPGQLAFSSITIDPVGVGSGRGGVRLPALLRTAGPEAVPSTPGEPTERHDAHEGPETRENRDHGLAGAAGSKTACAIRLTLGMRRLTRRVISASSQNIEAGMRRGFWPRRRLRRRLTSQSAAQRRFELVAFLPALVVVDFDLELFHLCRQELRET